MNSLALAIQEIDGDSTAIAIPVQQVLLAGYTGRDRAKVMEHIEELERLGVAPPERIPMVYLVPGDLAVTTDCIIVGCPDTSGEVEFYLVQTGEGLLVGLGSDHTDRKEEAVNVAASKALCPKVMSREVWRHTDLSDHWDCLEVRSWSTEPNGRRLYQDGRLDSFLPPQAILDEVRKGGYPLEGRVVFGGTLPLLHGFVYSSGFEAELYDPILDRRLAISYEVTVA